MIIGIAGKAGSGKDTLGAEFEKLGWHRAAFARTLKLMLEIAGFPEPSDPIAKESKVEGFDFTWREAAQSLGTEWGRALDPDIWMKIVELGYLKSDKNWIITDVRFENEAEMIRRNGGFIIHLTGRAKDLGDRATHVSEKPLSMHFLDMPFDNSGDIQDLARLAKQVNESYAR